MRTALVLQVSLLLFALAPVHAGDGFPAFTWDHVPLYAHLGIDKEGACLEEIATH
ncbi:MAG: hypothetical protein ACYSWZ_10585 [Planctomycetota bacterium]|jgi:hypothetical protein